MLPILDSRPYFLNASCDKIFWNLIVKMVQIHRVKLGHVDTYLWYFDKLPASNSASYKNIVINGGMHSMYSCQKYR